MTNSNEFEGKVALVTGAAGGLGQAIARKLADDGAQLVLCDLDISPLRQMITRSATRSPRLITLDVTAEASIRQCFDEVAARFGGIDILVNNAGLFGTAAPIEAYPAPTWRKVIDVNLTGTFLCAQAAVPLMRDRKGGRILNIASIAGHQAIAGNGAYGASKAAVIWLTRLLGLELVKDGILVNCIIPSTIDTGDIGMANTVGDDLRQEMASRIPLGRLGLGDEVAEMAAWICSSKCSFTTGGVFDISGGRIMS